MGPTDITRIDAVAGDDIAVVPAPVPPRRRRRWWMAGVAIAIALTATIVFMLGSDDDGPTIVRTIAPAPTNAPAPITQARTSVPAKHAQPANAPTTAAPTSAAPTTAAPTEPSTAPRTRPRAVTPPPPTPAPHAELTATVAPSRVTVHSGDALVVVLTVANHGNATGRYWWANDTCERALVPPPDRMCGQARQTFAVPPDATVEHKVKIDTGRATPGSYNVAFETVSVTVVVE